MIWRIKLEDDLAVPLNFQNVNGNIKVEILC